MNDVRAFGRSRRIAIIGGGFSGSLTAVQLLRQASEPIEIILFEREGGRLGKGLAYGTTDDCHLLNVPAAKMSALPDEPDHFINWAKHQGGVPNVDAQAFLQRRLYGTYIRSLLLDSVAASQGTHQVLVVEDEVIDIASGERALTLHCRSGAHYFAEHAVLALGNFPPGDPPETAGHRGYHPNPWREHALPSLLQSRTCLMIGSGLTMLDLVMSMHERRYEGVIHVVSRRGLMPQAHRPAGGGVDIAAVRNGGGARELTRTVRDLIKTHGGDWRAVVDAMRPYNPEIWQRWSLSDRLRFIRHVRPYWENRRHRSASSLIERFEALVSSGRVQSHQGRVGDIREDGDELVVSLMSRTGTRTIQVDSVVNCTGAECNFRKLASALVQNLLTRGVTACDPVGFGITVDTDGALRDSAGNASQRLFTLGPPMKGTLWETTAVPELRQQAAALAARLLA